jgi:hypothetical protein
MEARPAAAMPVDFAIDCEGLSAELRASLEARARADLSLKGRKDWHLQIICEGRRAAVEFTPAGGPVSRREGGLPGEPEDWVDRLLSLVHDAAAIPDEPLPPTSAAFPPSQDASPQAAPPEKTPQAVASPKQIATPSEISPAPAGATNTVRLEPEASIGAEVWTAEPLVLVGPAASIGVRVEQRLRIVPSVAAAWSVGSNQEVAVRSLEGGVDALVGKRWWFGIGARAAWLRFEPRRPFSPITRTIVDPSLVVRVGFSASLGSSRLSTSMGVRAYAERRDIRLDGAVTLRVPNVAALASIGYAVEAL